MEGDIQPTAPRWKLLRKDGALAAFRRPQLDNSTLPLSAADHRIPRPRSSRGSRTQTCQRHLHTHHPGGYGAGWLGV